MSECFDLFLTDLKSKQVIRNAFCFADVDYKKLITNKEKYLHANEMIFFDSLSSVERKKSYILGRYSAKTAIINLNRNVLPSQICVSNGVFHFPYIEEPVGFKQQISISHTSDHAVSIAYDQSHPMAVDLENIDARKIDVIKPQCSPHEINIISSLFDDLSFGFTLLWTAKEALSKVLKCGLLIDFNLLEIDNIIQSDDQFTIKYKNFAHYQGLSVEYGSEICTLVYPTNTQLCFESLSLEN